MSFRVELFVSELDASARFYERALGFQVERRDPDYVGLRRGRAVLGLAPLSSLPPTGDEPGFTQERVLRGHGAGARSCSRSTISTPRFAASQRPGTRFQKGFSSARGVSAISAS